MKIDKIIIHHTAVSHRFQADQFNAVNEYHRQLWNFKSSLGFFGGYNYIISASGEIKQYRADGEETAHTAGRNHDSLGIALCGNFDIERPTIAQITALKDLLLKKMTEHSIVPDNIFTHRQYTNKSCPGWLWKNAEIRALFQPDISYYQNLLNSLKDMLNKMKLSLGSSDDSKSCIGPESRG